MGFEVGTSVELTDGINVGEEVVGGVGRTVGRTVVGLAVGR